MGDSLLGMFGSARAPEVSFDVATIWGVEDLLVGETDSLSLIATKMKRCKEIVETGGSLAVALGTLPREGGRIDYGKAAYDEMTPTERTQYDAWANGATLPQLRVEEDRAEPNPSRSGRTRDERRLAWLKRAYKNDKISAENLAFFHTQYTSLIPLLCAGAKVIGQERAATNNLTRDARYLAEQVAAARLAGAASARQNTIQAEVSRLNLQIADGVQALSARKEAMRPEEGGGRKRQVPINEARSAVGLPALGAVERWTKEGAAGRGNRFLTGPGQVGPSRGKRGAPGTSMDIDQPGPSKKQKARPAAQRQASAAPASQTGGPATGTRGKGKSKQPVTTAQQVRAPSPAYTPTSPRGRDEDMEEEDSVHFVL